MPKEPQDFTENAGDLSSLSTGELLASLHAALITGLTALNNASLYWNELNARNSSAEPSGSHSENLMKVLGMNDE